MPNLTTISCPAVTATEVATLRAAGIEPTLDELTELIYWGQRVESPDHAGNVLLDLVPLSVGAYQFPALTIQAQLWIELASAWFGQRLIPAAICYASLHGSTPGGLSHLLTQRAAVDAVTDWVAALALTQAQLDDAAARLLGPHDPTAGHDEHGPTPTVTLADVLADLEVSTGRPAAEWLANTSDHLLRCLRALYAARQQVAGNGTGHDEARKDESRDNMLRLCTVAERIRADHQGRAAASVN